MRGKRLWQTLRLCSIRSPWKRAIYLKKVFASVGDGCTIMSRKVPLYPELISIGNNVHLASSVYLTVHDITHIMINRYLAGVGSKNRVKEKMGCIQIGDNVFIGSGSTVLGNVKIGSNVVIGAYSLVNRDIPDNSVAVGTPAKVIRTFDSFVDKRLKEGQYPEDISSHTENINPEFAKYLWDQFKEQRKDLSE